MKAHRLLAIFVIFSILILSSCTTSSIQGERIVDEPVESVENESAELSPEPATCEDVTCSDGKECKSGECVCASGTKSCGDTCIDTNACCSAADCSEGQTCTENKCEDLFSCEDKTCPSNQFCSVEEKGCTCPKDYKWCERQEQCIPVDHCCSRFDCSSNERCTDTITSAELCAEGDGKACKIFDTTEVKELSLSSKTYVVNVTKVNYVKDVHVSVEDQEYTLAPNQPVNIDEGISLSIKKLRETGGDCRDFDRET